MILDSGTRREFDTGAVRDIQEGKGRCDLLPLDIAVKLYDRLGMLEEQILHTFWCIDDFTHDGEYKHLLDALFCFSNNAFGNLHTMFLEVAIHFEEGCAKYGPNNWQKGIPTRCYVDSALRHGLKWLRGDTDERHDRAVCWNLICCCWTCTHKPELNDYAKDGESNANI
jgi:hypothetical protein